FLEIESDVNFDVLFSPDNEDKVFNPGILSHEKSVKIITHVTQEKKLAVSYAFWLSEDFDPPISELLVFKEVPISMRLLPFSSENEEKVFKPGIYTFKKFQSCFLPDLSYPVSPSSSLDNISASSGASFGTLCFVMYSFNIPILLPFTNNNCPSASTSKFNATATNTTIVLVSTSSSSGDDSDDVSIRRGTGTTARGRRLLKVEDRIRKKGKDFHKAKIGSAVLEEMKKDAVDELKMNNNIPKKLGSEEMKKNLVMEDDNDSMMMVLYSDEMKKNVVNDLIINNSQPMFDSDLSLDMSWSDFDMSWLDSDTIDMSWINTYSEHGVNLNFHHGVEVLNRNIPAKMGSEEMKKNLVVEDDNDSMMIDNSLAILDSDEMKKNVVNEANDLMIPMLDSDLSLDMSWSDLDTFDVFGYTAGSFWWSVNGRLGRGNEKPETATSPLRSKIGIIHKVHPWRLNQDQGLGQWARDGLYYYLLVSQQTRLGLASDGYEFDDPYKLAL
nr:hypothetical protein [Tanacetum cinerariifolium]